MATATPAGPAAASVVHLVRRFAAPCEEVFRAWSEPDLFCRWFGAPGGATAIDEMDVRAGGTYRVEIRHPWGVGWTTYVVGEYLEVIEPERLVYTFGWERPPPAAFGMARSRVTVEFVNLGDQTEVRLTHELLDKLRLRAFHRFGWKHSLDRLVEVAGQFRS